MIRQDWVLQFNKSDLELKNSKKKNLHWALQTMEFTVVVREKRMHRSGQMTVAVPEGNCLNKNRQTPNNISLNREQKL